MTDKGRVDGDAGGIGAGGIGGGEIGGGEIGGGEVAAAAAHSATTPSGAGLRRLADAYAFAADAHAHQRRKGEDATPYVNHVCDVAHLTAAALEGDPDALDAVIAAALHDVVEDTPVGSEAIAARFGPAVATLVAELTDDPSWGALPLSARKARQAEKIAGVSRLARIVKLADQTSNLSDLAAEPEVWPAERHRNYLTGAEQVVAPCRGLAPALEGAFDAAADRLRAAIARLERAAGETPS